jgi:hypothetical protein
MIPNSLSGETTRDGEPNIAVDPANPTRIAASAFTPDPAASGSAPIYVSTDQGQTWALNVKLPGGNKTNDTSIRFAGSSGDLYVGILRSDNGNLNILRDPNFSAAGAMTTLINRANDDQPWVEAATVLGGAGAGTDRVYVSSNDTSQRTTTGLTASVDLSLDAATAAPPGNFNATARLDPRPTASLGAGLGNQDGPSVRTAIHPNGTLYGAYFGWRTFGTPNVSDVVVVRDDGWAAGANQFQALLDPIDGLVGIRVVTGVQIAPLNTTLGTQRIGSQIAIAVDPRDSNRVYLAWCDGAAAATYTLHLRRSIDGGQTWSADLRAVVGATNPGLAVNVRGRVAFLYQQLGNPGTGNRWRTHLELSDDGFGTVAVDVMLADVPDSLGTYGGSNPLGDYANIISIGKDFYGVFSAFNTPDNANFPNGVTYQRNANFGTNTLLANDGVTPVGASIDPFFFHWSDIAPEDDFYVRDWTDSPTSGDTGVEPSVRPQFYTTSDVWNRRGTLDGFPTVDDRPANEDAGNGAGNIGDNWAFARIRRNAQASAGSQTVTAHFLVSKLGTGSNYVDSGSGDPDVNFPDPDPTVTFNGTDIGPIVTTAYHWHLNAIASTHLCLAVEITAANDPFVPPSLVGRAPGWGTQTDLGVLFDNNKAQRNLGLSTTPARGPGLSDDAFFAIVHNGALDLRDFVLRWRVDPAVLKRMISPRIHVVGGKQYALRPEGTIVLENMEPGENRWVGLLHRPPAGREGERFVVNFTEEVRGIAVNGFALGTRLGSLREAATYALGRHRSVFTRLQAALEVPRADREANAAAKLLAKRTVEERDLVAFIESGCACIEEAAHERLVTMSHRDPFAVVASLEIVRAEVKSRKAARGLVAHVAMLNRLDAFLTMLQLEQGDPSDVLQTVRWQWELFTRPSRVAQTATAKKIASISDEFITAYSLRKASNKDYPTLLTALVPQLRAAAKELRSRLLEQKIGALEEVKDLAASQRAHREVLREVLSIATPG